jgi:hypothetical protein
MKHYIWMGVTLLAIVCSIALMAQTVVNGYRIGSAEDHRQRGSREGGSVYAHRLG